MLRAAGVYLLLVAAFFWPLFTGRIPGQSEALYFMSPWDSVRPAGVVAPGNRTLDDQTREFLAFFTVARESFARGELPLWNPYIMAGTPLLANSQSALLFPLNLGHYLFEPPWGSALSVLLKLLLSALAAYALGRALGVSHLGALISGTAYGFASFTVFWLGHPHTNVTLLFPLALAAVERIVTRPGARSAVLLALVVALELLGGHVELAFLAGTAAGLYLLLRSIQEGARILPGLRSLIGGHLLGAGIGGTVLLPFLEFLRESITWEVRSAHNPFYAEPLGLLTLLVPDSFEVAGWGGGHLQHGLALYVGVVPLLLAVTGLLLRPRGAPLALAALGLFGLLLAYGFPPLAAPLARLPLFRQNPNYYAVLYSILATSLLAGFGLDALTSRGSTSSRPDHRADRGERPLTGPSTPVGAVRSAPHAERGAPRAERSLAAAFVLLAAIALVCALDPGGVIDGAASRLGASDPAAVASAAGATLRRALVWLLGGAILAFAWWWSGRRLFALGLLGLSFADLWLSGSRWNPSAAPEHGLPPRRPPVLEAIRGGPGVERVAAIAPVLPPNTGVYAGLADIRGYDVPALARYHHFFREALGGRDTFWIYDLPALDPSAAPFFNLSNVAWFLSRDELPGGGDLEAVRSGEVRLYRNPAALPRAFVVHRAELVPDATAALARTLALGDELRDVVVLEGSPATLEETSSGGAATARQAQARVVEYAPRRAVVELETGEAGWLVLSDTAYPGWRARVDGEERPVRHADYLFRAVRVGSGAKRVEFDYTPWSATLGLALSLASIGACAWLWTRGR